MASGEERMDDAVASASEDATEMDTNDNSNQGNEDDTNNTER